MLHHEIFKFAVTPSVLNKKETIQYNTVDTYIGLTLINFVSAMAPGTNNIPDDKLGPIYERSIGTRIPFTEHVSHLDIFFINHWTSIHMHSHCWNAFCVCTLAHDLLATLYLHIDFASAGALSSIEPQGGLLGQIWIHYTTFKCSKLFISCIKSSQWYNMQFNSWEIWKWFYKCVLKPILWIDITSSSHEIVVSWVNLVVRETYQWYVNIGSGNGWVLSGNTLLPHPMLTLICVATWRH